MYATNEGHTLELERWESTARREVREVRSSRTSKVFMNIKRNTTILKD